MDKNKIKQLNKPMRAKPYTLAAQHADGVGKQSIVTQQWYAIRQSLFSVT